MKKIDNLFDVVAYQLCCGCGVCAHLYPEQIEMTDIPSFGCRPILKNSLDPSDHNFDRALEVCPGLTLSHGRDTFNQVISNKIIDQNWGTIIELWEGYSTDSEIRFTGSSGGVMSTLALYCLEQENMAGCLHITADPEKPYLNKTIMSRSRESILAAAGSRYSPASPCEKLNKIQTAPEPCVFMGKPCDVAAVHNLSRKNTVFAKKIGLSIACFCAGTPSTNGTLEMLRQMGLSKPEQLSSLRYRGCGWPGKTVATETGNSNKNPCHELTYQQSWGEILQKHRQWRCYICPDHTGEFADISVGDPWYRKPEEGEHGRSLILARTNRGKQIIDRAIAAGYLTAEKKEAEILPASQPNLLKTRARLWGQLTALKLFRVPHPIYNEFALRSAWLNNLTLSEKINSILGTVKRVYIKKLKEKQIIISGEQK